MRRKKWFIAGLLIIVIGGGGAYFVFSALGFSHPGQDKLSNGTEEFTFEEGEEISLSSANGAPPGFGMPLVRQPIRPAAGIVQIRGAGNIALQEQETIVSKIEALITAVHVKVGNPVVPGSILVEFDTQNLERQVEEARFELAKSQTELKKLTEVPSPEKIAAAQLRVSIALEELKNIQGGPSQVELQVAEAEVFAAWAKYNELLAGKTDDQLARERIALHQAERKLKRAQEDYDSVSWRSNFELAETNARILEEATDAYESAKVSYNEATKPAAEKDLRESYSAALQAQEKLEKLRQKPDTKEIAEAELKVQEAQEELKKLTDKPDPDKLTEQEMAVQQKVLLLAEAEAKLAGATLTAPFSGTVIAIDAQVGKTAEVNKNMVTIANLQTFKLTVNIPEAKIERLYVGQAVDITLDALPGKNFTGKISYISPISADSAGNEGGGGNGGVVTYAVTVQPNIDGSAGVRSGMTAVISFVNESLEDAWLVPTTLLQQDGNSTTVLIYRNNKPLTVAVTPDFEQGEWTVVHSPDLQEGDEVEAELGFSLNEEFPLEGAPVVAEEWEEEW